MDRDERYRLLVKRAETLEGALKTIRTETAENHHTDVPVRAGRRLERAHVAACAAVEDAHAISAIVRGLMEADED